MARWAPTNGEMTDDSLVDHVFLWFLRGLQEFPPQAQLLFCLRGSPGALRTRI
jgi:hypothetical protein